jgi:hypothetical protein
VSGCGRATQLDFDAAVHQFDEKLLVRIAGRYHSFRVVGVVVQGHVTSVCVKDRNDPGLDFPVDDVIRHELQMKNGRRQVPFKRQVGDAEGNSKVSQSYWDIDAKRFL